MKRLLILPVLLTLLFAQCRKEQLLKVTYVVYEDSQDSPEYTITYTADKTGATAIASANRAGWESGTMLLEPGQFVSMKVDCNAPLFDIRFKILVNGYIFRQEEHMSTPTSSKTISGNL
jgi:hypothetical protein